MTKLFKTMGERASYYEHLVERLTCENQSLYAENVELKTEVKRLKEVNQYHLGVLGREKKDWGDLLRKNEDLYAEVKRLKEELEKKDEIWAENYKLMQELTGFLKEREDEVKRLEKENGQLAVTVSVFNDKVKRLTQLREALEDVAAGDCQSAFTSYKRGEETRRLKCPEAYPAQREHWCWPCYARAALTIVRAQEAR